MASLLILGAALVIGWLANAWGMGASARAVGSRRGRFSVGLAVLGLLVLLNVGVFTLERIVPTGDPTAASAISWGLLALQVFLSFLIIQRAFALRTKRAFAPFGAYIGVGLLQLGFALFVIRPYFVEGLHLPTESMSPTIERGQKFFVNKLIEPRRLDFVVYWNHDDPPLMFCKRLIALPGERLRFEGGNIFINDEQIELPEVLRGKCHACPGGGGWGGGAGLYQDGETIGLGADEYFLVGDNIDRSLDSRANGPTRQPSLIGVVDFIYWPIGEARFVR